VARKHHGKWTSFTLHPPAAAALEGLQQSLGLSMSDITNLALVALAQEWVSMPEFELHQNTHKTRKGHRVQRRVEWLF
jgi:hypothetical protein